LVEAIDGVMVACFSSSTVTSSSIRTRFRCWAGVPFSLVIVVVVVVVVIVVVVVVVAASEASGRERSERRQSEYRHVTLAEQSDGNAKG
jgi:uncharacterized membrane protein